MAIRPPPEPLIRPTTTYSSSRCPAHTASNFPDVFNISSPWMTIVSINCILGAIERHLPSSFFGNKRFTEAHEPADVTLIAAKWLNYS